MMCQLSKELGVKCLQPKKWQVRRSWGGNGQSVFVREKGCLCVGTKEGAVGGEAGEVTGPGRTSRK
jgi:hypothetical protein